MGNRWTDCGKLAREDAAIRAEQTGREMARRARLRAADARWNEAGAPSVPVTRREGRGGTVIETRGRRCGGVSAARTVRIADVSPLESARLAGRTGALTSPSQRMRVDANNAEKAARRAKAGGVE